MPIHKTLNESRCWFTLICIALSLCQKVHLIVSKNVLSLINDAQGKTENQLKAKNRRERVALCDSEIEGWNTKYMDISVTFIQIQNLNFIVCCLMQNLQRSVEIMILSLGIASCFCQCIWIFDWPWLYVRRK